MALPSPAESRRRRVGVLMIGVLLFGVTGGTTAHAGEEDSESHFGEAYLRRFGRDFGQVITAPTHWGRSDILTLTAVSGSGLLLMLFDQDIRDWAQEQRTGSSDRASSVFTVFGNGAVLLGLSAAIYTVGEIDHDDGLRKTALLSLESLATASFISWTTKMITGRARPYTGESSGSFHPFTLESRFWSFPSGHATAAFSVATIIALQSRPAFIDIAAYSLASLAAISRVHDNKHWASDVFIGSALGYFVARKIVDLNRPGEKKTVELGFQSSGGRQAVSLSIAF